jgi:hypothetical protein
VGVCVCVCVCVCVRVGVVVRLCVGAFACHTIRACLCLIVGRCRACERVTPKGMDRALIHARFTADGV